MGTVGNQESLVAAAVYTACARVSERFVPTQQVARPASRENMSQLYGRRQGGLKIIPNSPRLTVTRASAEGLPPHSHGVTTHSVPKGEVGIVQLRRGVAV